MRYPFERKTTIILGLALIAIVTMFFFTTSLFQLGYGIPTPNMREVRYVNTDSDTTVTVTKSGGVNDWTYLSKTYTVSKDYCGFLCQTHEKGTWTLTARLRILVSVSPLAAPREITNQTILFKVAENENFTSFNKVDYHVYTYSFRIATTMSGDINIAETNWFSDCPYSCRGKDAIAEEAIRQLISTFNNDALESAPRILWDLNAPTIAQVAIPSPGYVGLLGLFLQDYRFGGLGTGTTAEVTPKEVGSVVAMYLDQNLSPDKIAFHVETPVPEGYLLPADPSDFATPYAYWQTSIISMGSYLVFSETAHDYPNWWQWSADVNRNPLVSESCLLPCVAQWFRADLVESTSTPLEVPNFKIPDLEQQNQIILIPVLPGNFGTLQPPGVPIEEQIRVFFESLWNTAKWIIIGLFILAAIGVVAFILRPKVILP